MSGVRQRNVPKRVERKAEVTYLRRNTKMLRRTAIRRILAGRYHTNGIKSLEQLQEELRAASGIEAHVMTLSTDLREMGAIKVRDAERPAVEWWVLPAYNPNAEDLRESMEDRLIEAEVAHKLAAHAVEVAPIEQFIYVMTEARAGPLVGYWLSWLSWHGIVAVQEHLDMCIVHCLNPQAALDVAARLLGDVRMEEDDNA